MKFVLYGAKDKRTEQNVTTCEDFIQTCQTHPHFLIASLQETTEQNVTTCEDFIQTCQTHPHFLIASLQGTTEQNVTTCEDFIQTCQTHPHFLIASLQGTTEQNVTTCEDFIQTCQTHPHFLIASLQGTSLGCFSANLKQNIILRSGQKHHKCQRVSLAKVQDQNIVNNFYDKQGVITKNLCVSAKEVTLNSACRCWKSY
jgi:BarA-like signal transduction histidine kinase